MLKFLVYNSGAPAESWPLRNAYMIGSDGNAVRADLSFEDGMIFCRKRESGMAALALQCEVGELGEMTVQTCLLPERDEPYLLTLELARHRLMTLYNKLEDWSMFDLDADHPVQRRAERSRRLFIEALCIQSADPIKAEHLAGECLSIALDGSEELALAHSELLLNRRKRTGAMPSLPIGCGIHLSQTQERLRAGLQTNFDFVLLPTPWKVLAPEESEYHWQAMDNWVEWAARQRVPIVAGPLISFEPSNLPDWLYIWEHDYDTVRDLIYEHVERVVGRYQNVCHAWNVVSGLHVNSHFTFNFEQLMDLTRMTTMLVKKVAPAAKAIVELRQPFGEYYAGNQRSIPPLMYADLVVQSGINFDAFGIKLSMGQALSGQYTRDLMQLSNLIDQFQPFAKPLHLTLAAPSEPVTQVMIASPDAGEVADDNSGYWRRPWSQLVQSHWLEAAFQVAISKPFVDAVAWQDLADHQNIDVPLGGLISEQLQPKGAMRRLIVFRKNLTAKPEPRPDNGDTPTDQSEPVTEAAERHGDDA